MLKTNLSIVLLLSLFQANAMQLPVATPERRPIEESMFELFAHNQERMAALESTDKQLSEQTIEQAALNANQRVNGAKAQLIIDQEGRKKSSDLLKAIIENNGNVNEINQANQRLKERLELQAQEIAQLRGAIRESQAQQMGTQVELESHKHVAKWVYITGGAALVIGGIVIAQLYYQNGQLVQFAQELKNRSYVGQNKDGEMVVFSTNANGQKKESYIDVGVAEIRHKLNESLTKSNVNLSQMQADIALLKARPYVTKDHNNVLVLNNAPNGGGSVHGTHVVPFKKQ